jgi:CBS domain-containing protein
LKVRDLPPGRLLSVAPDATLSEVAKQMRVHDTDSVAVMADEKLLGIITERDLVRAIADGVNPQQARADVVMSANPSTVSPDEDVSVVAVKMMRLGIRHLPVVDEEGTAIGLLSARELIAVLDREGRKT